MLWGLPVLQRRLVSTEDYRRQTSLAPTPLVDRPSPKLDRHKPSYSRTLHVINDALLNMMDYMPWCMMKDIQVH